MLLAIDIGNTNIKFALYDGVRQVALWRARSDRKRTADEHAAFLSQSLILNDISVADITGSIVVSVVPEITPHVLTGVEYLTGKAALHAGEAEAPIAVDSALDRRGEIGRDLLVTALAAKRATYPVPQLIIGFGTATTFSELSTARANIAAARLHPGVVTSYKGLQEAAAKLPSVALAASPQKFMEEIRYMRCNREFILAPSPWWKA